MNAREVLIAFALVASLPSRSRSAMGLYRCSCGNEKACRVSDVRAGKVISCGCSKRNRPRRPLAERFWQKVNRAGPVPPHAPSLGACWQWTAGVNDHGYGHMASEARRTIAAHRVSWQLANGTIPDGLQVLHRCDNRRCVNPAHLFLGTTQDNTADMDAKGRRVNSPRSGEAHPEARLTAEDVRWIRFAKSYSGKSNARIAQSFGVSAGNVRLIVLGKTWSHQPARSAA